MIEIKAESACLAWQQAVVQARKDHGKTRDLQISIRPTIAEDPAYISAVSNALATDGKPGVCTVANTIFPQSLLRPGEDRQAFYNRYRSIWPRLQKVKANRDGTYFNRLIDFPNASGTTFNQLEHVITAYKKKIRRRSTLQCAILHPALDLKATPYKGFPCLQQIAFQPSGDRLRLVALYPTQYLWQRGLGNYLGLIALAKFMASQMECEFYELSCICLSAQLEGPKTEVQVLAPLLKWSL